MAGRFNLADYETVEERIRRFYAAHEDGRIITSWSNEYEYQGDKSKWVVKATIYLSAGDQANNLPKSTGYAVEIDGTGGANNGSALENAETSAIGRALANMNLSGNKRASREEMQKVQRTELAAQEILKKLEILKTVDEVRTLWVEANRLSVGADILHTIKVKADSLAANS